MAISVLKNIFNTETSKKLKRKKICERNTILRIALQPLWSLYRKIIESKCVFNAVAKKYAQQKGARILYEQWNVWANEWERVRERQRGKQKRMNQTHIFLTICSSAVTMRWSAGAHFGNYCITFILIRKCIVFCECLHLLRVFCSFSFPLHPSGCYCVWCRFAANTWRDIIMIECILNEKIFCCCQF